MTNTTLVVIGFAFLAGILAIKVVLDLFAKKELRLKYEALLRKNDEVSKERDAFSAIISQKDLIIQGNSETITGLRDQLKELEWEARHAEPSRSPRRIVDEDEEPEVKRRPIQREFERKIKETVERNRTDETPIKIKAPTDFAGIAEIKASKIQCPECQNFNWKPIGMVHHIDREYTQDIKCIICGEELTLKGKI